MTSTPHLSFRKPAGHLQEFVCNPDTGKWAFVPLGSRDESWREYTDKPFERRPAQGTALVVLNTTRECNFACRYCYVGEKGEEKMTAETGRRILDSALRLPQPEVNIVFHGSEPLTHFPFIRDMVEYGGQQGSKLHFSVQTNGSLLSDDIADFLAQKHVSVSISLDGTEELHNLTRPYRNGAPSYQDVLSGIRRIQQRGQPAHVITVVTRHHVPKMTDIIADYESHCIEQAFFSSVCPTTEAGVSLVPNTDDLAACMQDLYDDTIAKMKEGKPFVKVRNFPDMISQLLFPKYCETCLICSNGVYHPLLAVDMDGTVYPCDNFLGVTPFGIGTVFDGELADMIASPRNFRSYRKIDETDCGTCDWKRLCGGGCPSGSYTLHHDLDHRSVYCGYYRRMFDFLIEKIAELEHDGLLGTVLAWPQAYSRDAVCGDRAP